MGRKLLPLKMLQVLEAVVRCGGVSSAAKELGVTHGAVSRQIALLEDWLGRELFDRESRRFRPLSETIETAGAISDCLDRLEQAMRELTTARLQLKVLAHASFAMHWLVPRLSQFYALNPDVDVHVQTRQTGEDPRASPFDIVIMRGADRLGDAEGVPIIQEHLTLLTAHDRAAALATRDVDDLSSKTLAISDTRPGETEKWLKAAGLPPLEKWKERRFGHFHTALMAVLSGQAVVVGPIELAGSTASTALMAAPFPHLTVPGPYHTAYTDKHAVEYATAKRFVAWLREAASQT